MSQRSAGVLGGRGGGNALPSRSRTSRARTFFPFPSPSTPAVSEFWLSGKRSNKPREYWATKTPTPTTVFCPQTLYINEAPGINLFPRAFSLAYGKGPGAGYEVGVGYGTGSIPSRFVNQRSLPHTTWEQDK